mgnify:CR=1 FL=1
MASDLDVFDYALVLIYGLALDVFISGGCDTPRQKRLIAYLCPCFLVVQLLGWLALGELVNRTMMSKQQINHILNQLEEKTLIERVRPAENRRIVVLRPTDAARALAADVMAGIENTLAELFSSLENTELSEYLAAVRTINCILDRFPTGKCE